MPAKEDPGDIYSLKPTEGVLNLPPEMQAIVRSKGGLNILMEQVPPAYTFEEEAERFKALSSPVRIQILHALVTADLCPSILKNITGMWLVEQCRKHHRNKSA